MPSLEITELILLIMFPAAIVYLIFAATKRKDVLYYIPGFIALYITFISTNVEAFIAPDLFNLFEHLFILITGILLSLGALLDAYFNYIRKATRKKTDTIPKKPIGGNMK